MTYKKIQFTILLLLALDIGLSQNIEGNVLWMKEGVGMESLADVQVSWIGTTTAVQTNEQGFFTLQKTEATQKQLRFSLIGFIADTVSINTSELLQIILLPNRELDAVIVTGSQASSSFSTVNPINTETLHKKELTKAACCNLSESFETNATVDAEFSDAVTGAKTIKLLGLDGAYSQIMTENMPTVRGLATTYGLTYIPGPWIENIQITKGASSVVNGYESITGSINAELKEPFKTDEELLLVNVYGNTAERFEANVNIAHRFTDNLSTSLLTHTSLLNNKMDDNQDTFLDVPLNQNYIVMNRWNYYSGKSYEAEAGIKYISSKLTGGQTNFNPDQNRDENNGYGIGVDINRTEVFLKNGFVFKRPNTSIGTILNGAWHQQNSFFGLNEYIGNEKYFNANLITQTYISNTNHLIKFGGSVMLNQFNESFDSITYQRNEKVPGIFAEYYFKQEEKFSMLVGLRSDFHNLYQTFISPRLHLRYAIMPQTTLRASAGKGYRVANIFTENTGILTSSRTLTIGEPLLPEEAWNFGFTLIQLFTINGRDATFTFDAYRTDFVNQVVIDIDTDVDEIRVSNLNGKSFSNSLQAELNYEFLHGLDFRIAYKYVDARSTFNDVLLQVPLTNKHRGLVNIAYELNKIGLVFDLTAQYYGATRLPITESNPSEFQFDKNSPDYFLLLGQITKKWPNFELYIGSENLTNFTQKNAIIAFNDPFGNFFDASIVYAPIMQRNFYGGLRFTIKNS